MPLEKWGEINPERRKRQSQSEKNLSVVYVTGNRSEV